MGKKTKKLKQQLSTAIECLESLAVRVIRLEDEQRRPQTRILSEAVLDLQKEVPVLKERIVLLESEQERVLGEWNNVRVELLKLNNEFVESDKARNAELMREIRRLVEQAISIFSAPLHPDPACPVAEEAPTVPAVKRDVSYLSEVELAEMLKRGYVPLGLGEMAKDGDFGWWTNPLGEESNLLVDMESQGDTFGWEMKADDQYLSNRPQAPFIEHRRSSSRGLPEDEDGRGLGKERHCGLEKQGRKNGLQQGLLCQDEGAKTSWRT